MKEIKDSHRAINALEKQPKNIHPSSPVNLSYGNPQIFRIFFFLPLFDPDVAGQLEIRSVYVRVTRSYARGARGSAHNCPMKFLTRNSPSRCTRIHVQIAQRSGRNFARNRGAAVREKFRQRRNDSQQFSLFASAVDVSRFFIFPLLPFFRLSYPLYFSIFIPRFRYRRFPSFLGIFLYLHVTSSKSFPLFVAARLLSVSLILVSRLSFIATHPFRDDRCSGVINSSFPVPHPSLGSSARRHVGYTRRRASCRFAVRIIFIS